MKIELDHAKDLVIITGQKDDVQKSKVRISSDFYHFFSLHVAIVWYHSDMVQHLNSKF